MNTSQLTTSLVALRLFQEQLKTNPDEALLYVEKGLSTPDDKTIDSLCEDISIVDVGLPLEDDEILLVLTALAHWVACLKETCGLKATIDDVKEMFSMLQWEDSPPLLYDDIDCLISELRHDLLQDRGLKAVNRS